MSLSIKVADVMPLANLILLVTFENGVKKKYDEIDISEVELWDNGIEI